jgi:hypothetical protein
MENSEPNTLSKNNSEGLDKSKNLILKVEDSQDNNETSNLKLIKKA